MVGMSAFGHGLQQLFLFFTVAAVTGAVGIAIMAISVGFSIAGRDFKKRLILTALILAVIGTVVLIPAIIVGVIFFGVYIYSIIEMLMTPYGGVDWSWLPLVLLSGALPVFVVVYDVKVIKKFVRSRKAAIPDDEQENIAEIK